MVDHVAFTSGAGALYHLAVPSEEHRADRPVALRGCPVEVSALSDQGGQIFILPVGTVGRHRDERQGEGIANLFEGILLEAVIGGDGIFEFRDVRLLSETAHHGLLDIFYLVFEPFPAFELPCPGREIAAGIVGSHPGTAERPSGGVGEVDAETFAGGFVKGVGEQFHPFGGQVVEIFVLVAFGSVDGGYFQSSETGFGISGEHGVYVGLADGACRPPPA